MSTQIERMQQLVEFKKNKSAQNTQNKRPEKVSGSGSSKGFNSQKTGGALDK